MSDIDTLATLGKGGSVPSTRMERPESVVNRVSSFISSDENDRAKRRALIKGLVDGNAPYRKADLIRAGRKDACNVNWRIAESMVQMTVGAFYDVFSEVPLIASVRLNASKDKDADKWSQIASEEFHKSITRDRSWDYQMQLSQNEMVVFGAGPIFFEDDSTWMNKTSLYGELLLPDNSRSDLTTWEEAARLASYSPHELYYHIRTPELAKAAGWNVGAVQKAIINAHPKLRGGRKQQNWEWHQSQLKTGSFDYSSQSSSIDAAHYLFQEFPTGDDDFGKITHVIVSMDDEKNPGEFLFRKIGRFSRWEEVVHPMYYDNSGGGLHYAVTGMGSRMYAAMEYQNRLLCKIAEDVFAPKIMFQPTTANADQSLSIAKLGPWAKIPPGYDFKQLAVPGLIEDSVVFNRELTGIMSANLAQFRQNLQKQDGNPITAQEARLRAQEQARLGKTQLNRYYFQLDWLYEEKYRRISSPSATRMSRGGAEAEDFRRRCVARGVPASALSNIDSVKAVRVAGQGSQATRQLALQQILGIVAMLPKGGQRFLIQDFISAIAGQQAVERYVPEVTERPGQDHVHAALQLAAMKDGVRPVVTEDQDPEIYAETYIAGAVAAVEAVQATEGQNAAEVLAFLEIVGPAIAQRLAMMEENPLMREKAKALEAHFRQLAKFTDMLRNQIASAAQQAERNGQQQQAALTKEAMEAEKLAREEARRDAVTASDIRRKQTKMEVDIQAKRAKTVQALTAQRIKNNAT